MKIVDFVADATMKYIESMPKAQRKKYGQFFTSKETAIFMAGLFAIPENAAVISVLDPGVRELGFAITLHDKMPDIVLYLEDKNWLFFIESVTSVGPMEPKRIKEIEEMTVDVSAGKIYITAFLDFKAYKKFSNSLAWETEVWIADMPDHMIHLNGDKFFGRDTNHILSIEKRRDNV